MTHAWVEMWALPEVRVSATTYMVSTKAIHLHTLCPGEALLRPYGKAHQWIVWETCLRRFSGCWKEKHWLCKPEDPSSIPSTHVKSRAWWYASVISALGRWDREISGAYWPAREAESGRVRPVRDAVSQNKVDVCPEEWHSRHVHLHIPRLTHVHTHE
jgi:hypothetical protein